MLKHVFQSAHAYTVFRADYLLSLNFRENKPIKIEKKRKLIIGYMLVDITRKNCI